MKKLYLSISTIALVATPLVIVVSCKGDDKTESTTESTTDTINPKKTLENSKKNLVNLEQNKIFKIKFYILDVDDAPQNSSIEAIKDFNTAKNDGKIATTLANVLIQIKKAKKANVIIAKYSIALREFNDIFQNRIKIYNAIDQDDIKKVDGFIVNSNLMPSKIGNPFPNGRDETINGVKIFITSHDEFNTKQKEAADKAGVFKYKVIVSLSGLNTTRFLIVQYSGFKKHNVE